MSTDFRPLADALRAELAKPFAEEDVIERVAVEIENIFQEHAFGKALEQMSQKAAAAAIAAVRAHDAGMPCGHCTPNSDEVRCACEIEESHDER